jgi:hypothetical protein
VVVGVEGLVRLLDRDPALLELGSELAEESLVVVEGLLQLQAASLGKAAEQVAVVNRLDRGLQPVPPFRAAEDRC